MVHPTQVPVSGPLVEFGSGFTALTFTSASVFMSVAWERGGNIESHRSPRGGRRPSQLVGRARRSSGRVAIRHTQRKRTQ